MNITKVSVNQFTVDFDASEVETLANAKALFDTEPETLIQNTLEESLKNVELGTNNLVDRIHAKIEARRRI